MASFSLFHHLMLSLLLQRALISPSSAQTHRNVSLGSSLTPLGQNTSWLSPSGEFAFGFYPLETDSKLFLLAIWFEKTLNRTIIWYANGDNPVQDGSRVELTVDGRLSLKDDNGQEVWSTSLGNATYAAMLDTGNFVLASGDASVLWQSFDNPVDTILPSQVLDLGTYLRSRMMDTDYSSGRFKLSVQTDGNLVFYPVAVPSGLEYDLYWASNTVGNGTKLVFHELGAVYLALNNGTTLNLTSGGKYSTRDFYQRATLDSDGVFRQYVHPKNGMRNGSRNQGWTPAAFQPPDICQSLITSSGSGVCGFNSYCKFGGIQRVDCKCPPQYSFQDSNRKYKGCEPNFATQSCNAAEKEIESMYNFTEMIDVDWPLSDYEHYNPIDEEDCKSQCLVDCFCAVAIYNNGDCWKKKLPLSNGKMGSYVQRKAFIKVPKGQADSKINLGSSLSAPDVNNPWVSPLGDFAFGFLPLGAGGDLFLLGIWFNKVADKAVVWYANRNRPVRGGSKVELTSSGRLVLYDEQGQEAWSANASSVSSAAMLDTGNFVLVDERSNNIWESFNNPTDTILPAQVLGLGTQLYSRLMENNYTQGRFKLSVQKDGNLVLYSVNVPTGYQYEPYWKSKTTGTGAQLIFNQSGYLYLNQMDGNIFLLTQSNGKFSTEDYYHRVTLDSDGVLRQYFYPKPKSSAGGQPGSWSVLWHLPDNICLQVAGSIGSGPCGFNSLCKLIDDGRPTCGCPPGYSFLDPSDMYIGCKPDGMLSCDLTEFQNMANVDWPMADYEVLSPVTENDCGQACLGDCLCAVAIYRNETCRKKRLPLSNGRVDSQTGAKALIKIPKDSATGGGKNHHAMILVLSITLGASALLNLAHVIPLTNSFFVHKKQSKRDARSIIGTHLRSFSYCELEVATNGFKDELGQGSFGTVYKGMLVSDAEILIAVKKLEKVAHDGEKEFRTEVSVIGQTNHKNLVRLLGFCDEGAHRLLVYEFMSHGSLADFLFAPTKPTWNQRAEIAVEIARGLAYLHEECSSSIIHCDIKPQNVLLDDNLTARISDFGLAKLLRTDQSRTSTGIRGTRGYVAPEWFRRTAITAKVDVYSYGIMLLETICCRKSIESWAGSGDILAYWAYDFYREGRLDKLVGNDMEAIEDARRLERFVMVAIWCVQEEPSLRPHMKRVTIMLEGDTHVPEPPDPSPISFFR